MPDREEAPVPSPRRAPEVGPLSVIVEALIEIEGPKKGRRLLKAAAKIVERSNADPEVLPFLSPVEREARSWEQRRTAEWFKACLPGWLSTLGHW